MELANDDGCLWESHCMAQYHLTKQFTRHKYQMTREYMSSKWCESLIHPEAAFINCWTPVSEVMHQHFLPAIAFPA